MMNVRLSLNRLNYLMLVLLLLLLQLFLLKLLLLHVVDAFRLLTLFVDTLLRLGRFWK